MDIGEAETDEIFKTLRALAIVNDVCRDLATTKAVKK
jgi:hypothetical protein